MIKSLETWTVLNSVTSSLRLLVKWRNNKNIIKEKYVKDQEGSMAFDYNSNAKTWQTNYSNQLNVEFPWNHDSLSNKPPVHSPPIFITDKMICKTISQMKKGKATGPSDVALEMILASQQHIWQSMQTTLLQKENCLRIENYPIQSIASKEKVTHLLWEIIVN